jgi:hypothetical protein
MIGDCNCQRGGGCRKWSSKLSRLLGLSLCRFPRTEPIREGTRSVQCAPGERQRPFLPGLFPTPGKELTVNHTGITGLFFCSSVTKCGLVHVRTSAGCPQNIQLPKEKPRWRERRDSGDGVGVRRGDARTLRPRMAGRGGRAAASPECAPAPRRST